MPISVTCQCGARLEIDEKFLGKEILCPDCQRPLPTTAPATPPPLELPDNRRTSGLAVLSLTLAMVGAFTIVGTIAAIVVGFFALREIAAKAAKLDGVNFARAGIAVGAVFTLITLAALVSPTVFGLDAFLREFALAGRLQYPAGEVIRTDIINGEIEIHRPRPIEAWAQYLSGNTQTPNVEPDLLILVNVREDAYLACQSFDVDLLDDEDALEKSAFARFRKSELVSLIGKTKGVLVNESTLVEKKPKAAEGTQEITFDIRIGGHERRCMMMYSTNKVGLRLNVLVACARRSRFERMQEDFRKAYARLKVRI